MRVIRAGSVRGELELSDHPERITPRQFHETEGLEDWRVLGEGACTYLRAGSFAAGVRLVEAIGKVAGPDDKHPDVDVRDEGVTVRVVTITPDFFGLTRRDVDMARRVSAVARELGIAADPSAVQSVQVTVDALSIPQVVSFWRALLGYADRGGSPEDLISPHRRGPMFWFQQMDAPRPQRNRMHVDVWLPCDQAEARIAAAIAAGGRLVTAEHAPSFWVLADPEGNEACVGTAGWTGPEPA